MLPAFRGFGLAVPLALISSLAVVPRLTAQSTSAYVYVQSTGSAGPVYGYSASSGGKLTAISGSPFKPGTAIVGSNKSEFFTIGKTLLHSWTVGSNGAIGAQKSQIAFMNYSGGSCGNTGDPVGPQAVLDHTGKSVYVLLQGNGDHLCTAYQTYNVNSDGSFTFNGDTQVSVQSGGYTTLPSILGNEKFAYADSFFTFNNQVIGFQRETSGTLQFFGSLNPTFSGSESYTAYRPDASPTQNFVVLQEYLNDSGFPQLGSFSVASDGTLTSTNTPSNMPTSALSSSDQAFSPNGALFAIAGNLNPGSGIEIYNFNGASPLTLYKKLLTGTPIDRIAWDNSNHLYATSTQTSRLYVFTVTSTSVTQTASYSITSPVRLVVVSQSSSSCSTPSSNGINVCSPAQNATVSSPVQVNARATVSGGVYRFELWSGSTKLVSVADSGTMSQSVPLAAGTYHLTFVARNTAGLKVTATRDITVK
ncbi:MAG TPA: Ig-like domain-containing protein [Terracidiphilus sp.]|jgi:hypothetical protein|nr:Ig-like domain-containing protein [Terracidiphilus sp.]